MGRELRMNHKYMVIKVFTFKVISYVRALKVIWNMMSSQIVTIIVRIRKVNVTLVNDLSIVNSLTKIIN